MPAIRSLWVLASLGLALAPGTAGAQWWLSSDAGLLGSSLDRQPVDGGLGVDLSGGYDRGGWSLAGGLGLGTVGHDAALLDGARRQPLGPLTLILTAGLEYHAGLEFRGGPGRDQRSDLITGTGSLDLAWPHRNWGLWLGYRGVSRSGGSAISLAPALGDSGAEALVTSIDPDSYRGAVNGGAWRQFGSLMVSAAMTSYQQQVQRWLPGPIPFDTLTPRPDTLHPVDSTLVTAVERRADLALSASWARGPLAVSLTAGTGIAGGGPLWGGLESTVLIHRDLALVARAGRRPGDPELGVPEESYLFAGMRLSTRPFRPAVARPVTPGASDFAIERVSEGTYRMKVVVPHALTVDLMGDGTDWMAHPLESVSADQWTTVLALEPGPHRFLLRVDGGAWRVPPGLTPVEDEFFDKVGLLVVP